MQPKHTGTDNPQRTGGILRHDWPLWLLILLTWTFNALIYPRLPAKLPTHWNVAGQIDQYTAKPTAMLIFSLSPALVYALMRLLPRLDPRRENYAYFQGFYNLLVYLLCTFLLLINYVVILHGLGYRIPVSLIVPVAVSGLMIITGNSLTRVRPNYFVGIRTPWTLADPVVWQRTHRVGGRLMVAGGIAGLLGSFAGRYAFAIFLVAILGSTFCTIAYSYYLYARKNAAKQ